MIGVPKLNKLRMPGMVVYPAIELGRSILWLSFYPNYDLPCNATTKRANVARP